MVSKRFCNISRPSPVPYNKAQILIRTGTEHVYGPNNCDKNNTNLTLSFVSHRENREICEVEKISTFLIGISSELIQSHRKICRRRSVEMKPRRSSAFSAPLLLSSFHEVSEDFNP